MSKEKKKFVGVVTNVVINVVKIFKMNIEYVSQHSIFECIVGSQAYGTFNEFSDTDYAGVMITGKEYFYGMNNFEQFREYPNIDKVVYEFRKAINLIADCNPNMLDLLFIPERCIVKTTKYWDKIRENQSLFLSKRIRYTFSGYAFTQFQRIKTHRKFLLDPPITKPERKFFGLPDSPIFPTSQIKAICQLALDIIEPDNKEFFVKELDKLYGDYIIPLFNKYIIPEERILAVDWLSQNLKSQSHSILTLGTQYIKDEYIDIAKKELQYYNAHQEWKQYQDWKKARNPKRADLEAKFGYDTKHAMHLVRLMRMGKEFLETNSLFVDRTNIDAQELIEIRNGSWSFDQIEQYIKTVDNQLTELYKTSTQQHSPNRESISNLCISIVDDYLSNEI